MTGPEDIVAHARWFCRAGTQPCAPDADILSAFRLAGDDGNEYLAHYAKTFSVDMEGFLWYFHYNANEPPLDETAWPYGPDGRKLDRIALTPRLLAGAANAGKWPLQYPEHVIHGAWRSRLLYVFWTLLTGLLLGIGLIAVLL